MQLHENDAIFVSCKSAKDMHFILGRPLFLLRKKSIALLLKGLGHGILGNFV